MYNSTKNFLFAFFLFLFFYVNVSFFIVQQKSINAISAILVLVTFLFVIINAIKWRTKEGAALNAANHLIKAGEMTDYPDGTKWLNINGIAKQINAEEWEVQKALKIHKQRGKLPHYIRVDFDDV